MSRTLAWTVRSDHPACDGHFPGNPVLPGVALLAEALEAIAAEPALDAALGPAPTLAVAKFAHAVRPGDTVALQLDLRGGGVDFRFAGADGRPAASGRFEPGT